MEPYYGRRHVRIIPDSESPQISRAEHPENRFREPSYIEVISNRIYFYAEVSREKVLQLVRAIRQLNIEQESKKRELGLTEPIPIYIYINSFGGEIFAGLSVMDEILNSTAPIITVVDGCCASAATLFSVVAKQRLIKRHAYMLVHQLTSGCWGKHQEFLDELQNQKQLMKMIKDVYREYTKLPVNKIDEILKYDLWFDAKTCMRFGLVDGVVNGSY
jgi:ATP-dependent protease ClpP protease subunit